MARLNSPATTAHRPHCMPPLPRLDSEPPLVRRRVRVPRELPSRDPDASFPLLPPPSPSNSRYTREFELFSPPPLSSFPLRRFERPSHPDALLIENFFLRFNFRSILSPRETHRPPTRSRHRCKIVQPIVHWYRISPAPTRKVHRKRVWEGGALSLSLFLGRRELSIAAEQDRIQPWSWDVTGRSIHRKGSLKLLIGERGG